MAGMRTTIGIICMGVYREVLWVLCHEYGKILRYTEQNTEIKHGDRAGSEADTE